MGLALPYPVITDPFDPEQIQGNFDEIKKQFPISRRHMKVEAPHAVGDAGEPAFQNAWVNFDTTTFTGARFWKDSNGIVMVEGMVKLGLIGAAGVIFTLPAGYRPAPGIPPQPAATNTGYGEVRVSPTGEVIANAGGNAYFSFSVQFKQES